MAQSTTVTPVNRSEDQGYAAGWWVNRRADGSVIDDSLPEDAYWAQGHDGQRLYVVPSQRLVVARLGFSPSVERRAHRPARRLPRRHGRAAADGIRGSRARR